MEVGRRAACGRRSQRRPGVSTPISTASSAAAGGLTPCSALRGRSTICSARACRRCTMDKLDSQCSCRVSGAAWDRRRCWATSPLPESPPRAVQRGRRQKLFHLGNHRERQRVGPMDGRPDADRCGDRTDVGGRGSERNPTARLARFLSGQRSCRLPAAHGLPAGRPTM